MGWAETSVLIVFNPIRRPLKFNSFTAHKKSSKLLEASSGSCIKTEREKKSSKEKYFLVSFQINKKSKAIYAQGIKYPFKCGIRNKPCKVF